MVKTNLKKKVVLEVKNVSKSFRLPTEQANGIKQAFINRMRGIKGYKEQKVLKDISFTVEEGDFFGIVGRNGSGKSTLLKLISQIYMPDSGEIIVNGKLVPFIELGVGFNPELTGRENVYLNGALLGFSHEEVLVMYGDIVAFAELEEFMDQKLKNYSSGMQVRLAFSIAIRADGAILVLDEVLAVGDESFQRKCFQYFAELKKNKKTVILVTHSMDSVQQFCNKAALIDKGHKLEIGNPSEIAQIYRELNNPKKAAIINDSTEKDYGVSARAKFKNMGDTLRFNIVFEENRRIKDPVVVFALNRDNGEIVYRWKSDEKIKGILDFSKKNTFILEIENIFPNGIFDAYIGVRSRDKTNHYLDLHKAVVFEVVNKTSYSSDVYWKPKEKICIE